jgi:hypothetical protein
MTTQKIILFALIFLPLSFYSCNNSNPTEANINIDLNPPLITGIVRTSEAGPRAIAIYGNPNEKSDIIENNKLNFYIDSPYPNPTDGSTSISFYVPVKTNVLVWIIKGRLSVENASGSVNYANSNYVSPFTNYFQILYQRDDDPGRYILIWSGRDQNGKILPDGVYRVYIEVNGQLMWRNIWLYRNVRGKYNPF